MTEKSVAAQVNWSWYPSKKLRPSCDEMRLIRPTAVRPCFTFFISLSLLVCVCVCFINRGRMDELFPIDGLHLSLFTHTILYCLTFKALSLSPLPQPSCILPVFSTITCGLSLSPSSSSLSFYIPPFSILWPLTVPCG